MDLTSSGASLDGAWPTVEGEQRPRLSCSGPVDEMVRFRIMHVDRDFDEAQTENLRIEVNVLLGIARDGGHVVQAQNG